MKYNKYTTRNMDNLANGSNERQGDNFSEVCKQTDRLKKKYLQLPLQCPLTVHEQSQEIN